MTENGAVNKYELFNTQRFADLRPLTDSYYNRIRNFQLLRNLERQLWQQVIMSRVSDNIWSISPPTQREIFEIVNNRQQGDKLSINVVSTYAFDRPQPAGLQRTDKELPILDILNKKTTNSTGIQNALKIALDPKVTCEGFNKNITFKLEKWMVPTIRLPSTIKPKVLLVKPLLIDVSVSRIWEINPITQQTAFWWEMFQTNFTDESAGEAQGIVFFTWSERVAGSLTDYPIVTFYVVIVLGIGRVIRGIILTNSEQIFIKDMPRPDSLLLIWEGILISRLENNLEREEELYFILIDIMRSPEVLKMITDSSLKKKKD